MARRNRREAEEAAIDLTPMLDVVFIMLIFFIVTTSFVKEAGISVQKPKASNTKTEGKATIFVAVRANGEIWLDKRPVDVERVGATIEKLLAESPSDTVIVQADKEAKHGVVVSVMDQIKLAGIDRIVVAAETK
jgi:biopolymer transport protein ExbD